MDGNYKYAVFFECRRSLNSEEEKRIENYFQIRRRSGGGKCAPLKKVNDEVFMIAFRDEKDQERVLGIPEHVLKVPGGHLSLTVRGSPGPPNPPLTTSTPNLTISPDPVLIPPAQSHLSILASTLPSSGVEHELQLDTYLQHYLRECPRAGKDLEQELSSMGCYLQFHPEEGMVLVTGSVQTNPDGDTVEQWKAQVEKLFERIKEHYLCHFEVNLYKARVLLQSRSSGQALDEVRVYSEMGIAVVVGEHSQVQARLRDLEDSQVEGQGSGASQKQGSGASQKQTTTRRLGEAKLRLLWDEIKCGLGEFAPGVKVMEGDAGQVVLEGFVGEVFKAGEWISEMEDHVLERMVPEVSPHLLAFLRKEYGVPGILEALLGVSGNLEIELGDTELRLFTLSPGKLEETETALRGKFKELKIDVPNCSAVPPELRAKLESRADEMNQRGQRAVVRFCSGSQIYLLGHAKEVGELNEEIAQFILDQPSQEGTVPLPFPEMADCLPELFLLHDFGHSGVNYHLVGSSSSPSVVLTGPLSQVTQVRSRLGSVLNSLVRETIIIDQPGALRFFQSPSGREKLQSIGHSQRCLIQLQDQDHITEEAWASSAGVTQGSTTVGSYRLNSGLQVLVRQGDITKEHADALVNAANEYLDHGGGVAAALSRAGGSKVQKESRDLVRQIGTIPIGDVVVTTGGNLNCKKLLHVVGPVGGAVHGRERALLEETVRAALNKAENMKFQTIAMPCISSGIFDVPVKVCAEAIVTAVRDFGSQGRSLKKVTLIDIRGEVVSAMKETCDRLLRGMDTAPSAPKADVFQGDSNAAVPDRVATAGTAVACIQVKIIQGNIEKQQVDALVCPMVGHDPLSTRVGNTLSSLVGRQLAGAFHKVAGGATLLGENVLVKGLSGLACDKVFFLNLIPWDNTPKGIAVQTLRQALRSTLASCDHSGLGSIALPVLGTGALLGFPHNVVAKVLLEEICRYEENPNRTLSLIRIIVLPNDKESTKAFQSAQEALHLKGFTNDADPDQASFYRHVSSTQDEVTAMLGGVRLQLVCGDIIHETTDVIVNTTNFSKKQSGVSKAILIAAGPSVQAEFAQAGVPSDLMCTTGPGSLACREIIHASFKNEGERIRKTCGKILERCERKGYRSAAFPAINTGAAGMDFTKACKAMLDGMASAVRHLNPNVLSLIRIVTPQRPVYQAFRSELESRLGQMAPQITLREKTNSILRKIQDRGSSHSQGPQSPPSATPGLTLTPWRPPPAVLCVIHGSDTIAASVKRDLETILQQQLTEKEVDGKDFYRLDTTELETIQVKARSLGVSLEPTRAQREESVQETGAAAGVGARGQSGLEGDVSYVLRGLKEDVLSVDELFDKALRRPHHGDLQGEEHTMLTRTVQWSMQDQSGAWRELSLYANYILEQGHLDKTLSVEIEGLHGEKMKVNLEKQEATDCQTDFIYKVKREETTEKEDISQSAPKLPIKGRDDIHPPLDVSKDRRIVILGKTGAGKSSIGNTIFREKVFRTNDSPNSETAICQAESRFVHGRNITLIDTPGFFDTAVSEEQLKPEITRCIAECAAGPHAILIAIKVEKFTSHENEVLTKICQYFSPEALRYATVLFTHGNQLPEGVTVQEFVSRSTALKDLVEKCGGRCHVIDNTYWNNSQQGNYRSNQFQVTELLNTIDKMVEENSGGYFTNEMLQDVEAIIQIEEAVIRKVSSGIMSEEEIRGKAKKNLYKRLLITLAGVTTGAVLGAFLGAVSSTTLGLPQVRLVMRTVKDLRLAAEGSACMAVAVRGGGALTAAGIAARGGGATAGSLGTAALVIAGTGAIAGAIAGGVIGYNAAEGAETPGEAAAMAAHNVQKTSKAVFGKGEAAIKNVKGFFR